MIPEKEFEKMIENLIINLKDRDINNEDQLAEFVSHES
jgi:hypothetical protein